MLSSKHNASGTNLQCANHVLFVEPPGTNATHGLSVETQAIGRTLRLGQTRQVRVKYFIVEDSIEQDIYAALQRVRDAASTTASSGPADSAEAAEQLPMDASTAVAHATAAVTPTAAVAGAYSNNTGPGTPAAVETSAASSARAAASVSPLSLEEDEEARGRSSTSQAVRRNSRLPLLDRSKWSP